MFDARGKGTPIIRYLDHDQQEPSVSCSEHMQGVDFGQVTATHGAPKEGVLGWTIEQ